MIVISKIKVITNLLYNIQPNSQEPYIHTIMHLTQINNSKQPIQQRIKKLSSQSFKPLSIPTCSIHQNLLLPQQLICLKSTCPSYLSRFCSHCTHTSSHLHNINHTVPILSQFLQNNWEEIRKQNAEVQHQWKVCQYNIKYCIDIFNEIYKLVKQSKQTRLYELPIFQGILKEVGFMYRDGVNLQEIIGKLKLLNDKYGLFQNQSDKQRQKERLKNNLLNSYSIQKDKQFRLNKWLKSGEQTKHFSEQALAFSQRLSQSIENRMKFQKRKKNLQDITAKKLNTLAQIIQQFKSSKMSQQFYQKMQQIPSLTIQLPQSHKNTKATQISIQQQSSFLTENLTKFRNLTSISLKNKNGKINAQLWQKLIKNFEYLKKLKQLRLHLRVQDLSILTKLFSARPNAVRHIPNLHLAITDEPKLDMKQVATFCNTLQLKQLYLILTRDNIVKNNYIEFLNTLRFKTSLSYLPLDVLDVNLTKNKIIDAIDIRDCTVQFKQKYKQVKHSTIVF